MVPNIPLLHEADGVVIFSRMGRPLTLAGLVRQMILACFAHDASRPQTMKDTKSMSPHRVALVDVVIVKIQKLGSDQSSVLFTRHL